jgi:hypothetical protein
MPYDGDPDHPIVERPWEFSVSDFTYHVAVQARHSYIDLGLRGVRGWRTLRFLGPQSLKIEEGFPRPTHGMCILDVRRRQLEGLGVRVADFEGSHGAITFWAREVIDLDSVQPRFQVGERLTLLKHYEWKADVGVRIKEAGRKRTIFDGTPHIQYVVEFDEPQLDTDGYACEWTSVLEDYLRPIE